MKQILFIATLLMTACSNVTQPNNAKIDTVKYIVRVNINDYERYQSELTNTSDSVVIIITPEQRDSLKKLGKAIKCPFGHNNETYYELQRIVLSDSTIGIWYIQPDSNRMFLDQKYYTIKKASKPLVPQLLGNPFCLLQTILAAQGWIKIGC